MMHRLKIATGVAGGALLCALAAPAVADQPVFLGSVRVSTDLTGYEEVPTLNSNGSGEFTARIRQDGSAIDYTLTYRDLPNVTQAHIHFGRPATTGGIVLWLCNQTASPPAGITPPACQSNAAATSSTVTGTLTPADLVPVPNQGVATFADVIDAIRNSAAYANIHTTVRPTGEIRGSLSTNGRDRDHGHHD